MVIDLKPIKETIGARIPIAYSVDLSDVVPTAVLPVAVSGAVVNRAGILLLHLEMDTTLHLTCDRCLDEFDQAQHVEYDVCVADHSEEDCDEIIVCENDQLELDELVMTAFVLAQESKHLCKEDCKGLCQICGVNKNASTCSCEQDQIDPRLEILRKLLEE